MSEIPAAAQDRMVWVFESELTSLRALCTAVWRYRLSSTGNPDELFAALDAVQLGGPHPRLRRTDGPTPDEQAAPLR